MLVGLAMVAATSDLDSMTGMLRGARAEEKRKQD
jgi:hypothetical protein